MVDKDAAQDIWEYPRANYLSQSVWDSCAAILEAGCRAWNALTVKSGLIASVGTRGRAQVKI